VSCPAALGSEGHFNAGHLINPIAVDFANHSTFRMLLHVHPCSFYIARDPIGVTCLYIGWGKDGSIWASNEMKCLKVRGPKGHAGVIRTWGTFEGQQLWLSSPWPASD
jgi:hypothetical protein